MAMERHQASLGAFGRLGGVPDHFTCYSELLHRRLAATEDIGKLPLARKEASLERNWTAGTQPDAGAGDDSTV